MRREAMVVLLVLAGCGGRLEPIASTSEIPTEPAADYCAPWAGVDEGSACTVLTTTSTAGTFGAGSRRVCTTSDLTIWTEYGPEGRFARYEPVGPLGTPGEWAPSRIVCHDAPDGRVLIRSPRSDGGALGGPGE
jgi:hypothetical protein